MPFVQQHPRRSNRYRKKGGRGGGFVLAAFLVLCVALVMGGYFLQRFLAGEPPQLTTAAPPPVTIPPVRQEPVVPQAVYSSAAVGKGDERQAPVRQDYDADTPQAQSLPPAAGRGRLAIIIDDMGSSLAEARALADIGVPLVFSIIPGLRHDRDVAAFAADRGVEIMVHMPMQSKEYPQRRLEANGLLLSHDTDEVKRRVESYLEALPQAVGANNHTGSAFTEDAGKMRVVLGLLKQRGLFFVDSITTPATTGLRVAQELDIPNGRRDVFLDNEQQESYINGQLAKAVARARRAGRAIAIGHPHPATITVLKRQLPLLKEQGVTLVSVSQLLR
ncbi:divergent polysaccharide deacetylase family protein [Trichlorobacter ammonificans]|uniref:Divergent polysaccharide deacetylase family protein n=1 Tax=Trichlorobacter ammonificans TaxID=2916410 RepID=A0ABM9D787_9BACT|nr:divergent polysaccharide deacetylase family protein [Trichlorobacter ammonificans]CAH2031020.1 conserved protein of unknown function [Trichlorobacter ammonificans]